MKPSELKTTRTGIRLAPSAADAWDTMVAAAKADGVDLGATDGYRSYAQQVKAKRDKPNLAATPGKSKHGIGKAVDVKGGNRAFTWLDKNASRFGFRNPIRKKEPWHWEYQAMTAADVMDTF